MHLSALLEQHDEYRQKVGCGVSHFSVMMTEYGTPCFVINRHDGISTDFSYRHCISQRPPTRKQEVSQALRRVVRFDLYAARDKFYAENRNEDGQVACAETGELIRLDEAHMDHRAPRTFEVLVITFLAARGIAVVDRRRFTAHDRSDFVMAFGSCLEETKRLPVACKVRGGCADTGGPGSKSQPLRSTDSLLSRTPTYLDGSRERWLRTHLLALLVYWAGQ